MDLTINLLRQLRVALAHVKTPCKTMKDVSKLCDDVYPALIMISMSSVPEGSLEAYPKLFLTLVPQDIPSHLLSIMGLCVRAGFPLCPLRLSAKSPSARAVQTWPHAADFLLCMLDACLAHSFSSPEVVTACRALMSQLQPTGLAAEPGMRSSGTSSIAAGSLVLHKVLEEVLIPTTHHE